MLEFLNALSFAQWDALHFLLTFYPMPFIIFVFWVSRGQQFLSVFVERQIILANHPDDSNYTPQIIKSIEQKQQAVFFWFQIRQTIDQETFWRWIPIANDHDWQRLAMEHALFDLEQFKLYQQSAHDLYQKAGIEQPLHLVFCAHPQHLALSSHESTGPTITLSGQFVEPFYPFIIAHEMAHLAANHIKNFKSTIKRFCLHSTTCFFTAACTAGALYFLYPDAFTQFYFYLLSVNPDFSHPYFQQYPFFPALWLTSFFATVFTVVFFKHLDAQMRRISHAFELQADQLATQWVGQAQATGFFNTLLATNNPLHKKDTPSHPSITSRLARIDTKEDSF